MADLLSMQDHVIVMAGDSTDWLVNDIQLEVEIYSCLQIYLTLNVASKVSKLTMKFWTHGSLAS